jgi:Tfp pilus assembly protein PilV
MSHREEGTTLIEVLVALLVLVSGIMGIAQLLLVAAAVNVVARDTTIAATLAAQKVEQLLSSDELVDAAERIDHVDAWGHVSGSGDTTPPDAVYTRRWSIDTLSQGVVTIRVHVRRSNRGGRQGSIAGETHVVTMRTRRRP